MKIINIDGFNGQHCETTATGTLLHQTDIKLSEPMLFGLGEGLSFIFWNMKKMDFPFIGGRIKPDKLTYNIAKNLNFKLNVFETSSIQQAWTNVKNLIDNDQAVGLKLDCYHLEYFTRPFHFAAHYAAIYGYDNHSAFLVDTLQQGGKVKTSLKSLALARSEKGPMASKNLYYTLNKTDQNVNLDHAIITSIKNCSTDYLNPPISNISYRGIQKTASEIIKWFKNSRNIETEFKTTAMMMEKAGTGGALFRNLYRDFLYESYNILKIEQIKSGYEAFIEISSLWTLVADLLEKAGSLKEIKYVYMASEILKTISVSEKKIMEKLCEL